MADEGGEEIVAIEILQTMERGESTGDAREAFLALALFSAGRTGHALRVALVPLAKALPFYGGSVTF